MGEQFVDLFAAGAYALEGRLLQALAQPAMAWLFYVLAAAGIIVSIIQSALESQPQLWLRHLATVAVASVLILMPHQIALADLTYAAPGAIENLFGTRTGSAPHLTYAIERLGAAAAAQVRDLMHSQPVLAIPVIASQVGELASDPASLNEPQLRANLQIWRSVIVPRLLQEHPDVAASLRQANLLDAVLNPAPTDARWVTAATAQRSARARALIAASGFSLADLASNAAPLLRQTTDAAGATAWVSEAGSVQIRLALEPPPYAYPPADAPPAYYDAVSRGTTLAQAMLDQLPEGNQPVQVGDVGQLHDLLARSILYAAALHYLGQDSRLATLGSYCQRFGAAACQASQAPLIEASGALRVAPADRYNQDSATTWLKQPIATLLLTVASLLLGTLASLVVAVLPFLLGTAKAIAILMSSIGLWMLLWPGRFREAISWMVLPVAFVALWTLLFNLWMDVETYLTSIASVVGHSDYGSFSAGRIMSIAISAGYLSLPAIALSILSGNTLRSLNHAGMRLEHAMLLAWRTRGAAISFARRWLANSPLARRWNQRAYRAVGLGSLRSARGGAPRGRRPSAAAPSAATGSRSRKNPSGKKAAGNPDDFKPV